MPRTCNSQFVKVHHTSLIIALSSPPIAMVFRINRGSNSIRTLHAHTASFCRPLALVQVYGAHQLAKPPSLNYTGNLFMDADPHLLGPSSSVALKMTC